jgi:hypothetical protein
MSGEICRMSLLEDARDFSCQTMATVSNTPIGTIKARPAQSYAKGIMDSMIPNAMSGPMIGSATSKKRTERHGVWSDVIAFLPGVAAGIAKAKSSKAASSGPGQQLYYSWRRRRRQHPVL